jgi:hypothetical protein
MASGLLYINREIVYTIPVYAITDDTFMRVYYHLEKYSYNTWLFDYGTGKMDLKSYTDSTTGLTWGPNTRMTLSPDVIAPGKDIFATVIIKKNSYTLDPDTSLAAPYVSEISTL